MATFEEQYKQLFGEELSYDPIDIGESQAPPSPRLALPVQNAAGADPGTDFLSAYDETMRGIPAAAPVEEERSQMGTAFRAGLRDVGSLSAGAVEYGARQAEQAIDPGVGREMLGDIRRGAEGIRQGFEQSAKDIHSTLTPESQAQIERKIFTLDPEQTIFQGSPGETASAIGLKLARMAPPSLVTLLGAAGLSRIGLADEAVTYMGATEGAMSLGGIQNAVANDIEQQSDEELAANSQAYAQMLQNGEDPMQARQKLIAEAQGLAPLIGGVTVAAISAVAGRYMEPLFTKGANGNIIQRFGRGYAIEAPQEGLQGSAEQYAQNIAAQLYDEDRALSQDVLSAGLEEGALGGIFGGGVAAIAGRSSQPEPPPPVQDPLDETGLPPAPPASFEEVFGTGGESPFIPPDEMAGPVDPLGRRPQSATERAVLEEGGQQSLQLTQPGELEQLREQVGVQQELDLQQPQTQPTVSRQPGQQALPLVRRERGGFQPLPEKDVDLSQRTPIDSRLERPPVPETTEEVQARTGDIFTGYTPQVVDRPAQARREKAKQVRQTAEQAEAVLDEAKLESVDVEGATTPTRAAARVMGEAVKTAAQERQNRIGGFYPPSQLEFTDVDQKARYGEAFDKLVTAELQIEQGDLTTQPAADRAAALKELTQIRTVARPRRKSERIAKAATEIAPGIGQRLKEEVAKKPKETIEEETGSGFRTDDNTDAMSKVRPEDVDTMDGKQLDDVFYKAAQIFAGKNTAMEFTYEAGTPSVGAAPDADEAIPTFLGGAETIPEGAEPLALQTTKEVKASTPPLELKSIEMTSPGRWKYTLDQAGSEVTGTMKGKKADVEARVQELIDKSVKRSRQASTRGSTLEDLLDAHRTPGMKRRLIKRVIAQLRRKAGGGKSGAAKITRKAKTVGTAGKSRQEATAFFDSSVLTRDNPPKDESVKARETRMERSTQARKDLRLALDTAKRQMDKLSEGKFAELLEEVNETNGDMTKLSLDLRYGRMYFRQILDFGEAMINSKVSTAAASAQKEKVTKLINRAMTLTPEQFAVEFSNLARADIRQSILTKPTKGDARLTALKAELANPATREQSMADYNNRLRQNTARLMRRTEIWQKNDLYNSVVGPLMAKFADSTFKDGYPSYRPTKEELEGLQWAMKHWNKEAQVTRNGNPLGTFRELMYKPIRRFFMDLGFTFDTDGGIVIPVDEDGNYDYQPSDKALQPLYRQKFKDDRPPLSIAQRTKSKQQLVDEIRTVRENRIEATERAATQEQIETEGRWQQVNRVIADYLDRIGQPKLTVAGLIRQEQRFIRSMKELGIWSDTPSPVIGKITHPQTGVSKTVSIAGPRLEAKKLSKDRARALMSRLSIFKLPAPAADIAARVARRARRELSSETDFFLREAGVTRHGDAFLDTAVEIRSTLNDSPNVMGHELLDKIIATTPEGHAYNELAKRLRNLESANVPVRWSGSQAGFTLANNSLGRARFRKSGNNFVMLNKKALESLQHSADTPTAAAATIHTLLHEMTHVATMNELRTNRDVAQGFKVLQAHARRHFSNRGLDLPYGLKPEHPVEEFVAEVFSNTAMQQELKQIKYEKQTLWQRLVDYVRQFIGLPADGQYDNMLELVMATADRVFTDTAYKSDRQEENFFLEDISDPVAKTYIKYGTDRIMETVKFEQRLKRSKLLRIRAPLSMMTLPQIRNEFKGRIDGLEEFYKAFKRRDARNAELMETADRLSREWTKNSENDKAGWKIGFSILATDSTVHDVHPDVPITHEKNAHVTQPAQKAKHAELAAEFNKMPDGFKKLWGDLQAYYRASVTRESILLTQNALRGVLTKGANAPMSAEKFEATYTKERIAELDTTKKLRDEFGDMLSPEMISTVAAMRTLPQKRTGPYFPIMRYGEFVVEASKLRETKSFDTTQEARAWQAEQLAMDPTLEISISKTDLGGGIAKVTEKTFLLAENATVAQENRDELVKEYGEENVSAITLKMDYGQASTIQSNEALNRILSQLEDNKGAQAAVKQYYLRSLADSSFRKHEAKRKNRRGYDASLQHRNFTNYAQSASYYTAQLEHGWQMSQAMAAMRADVAATKGAGPEGIRKAEVYKQLDRRDQMTTDPMVINKLVRKGVAFAQFTMLTSPSYWMINATQPYMVSLPYMAAKHGYGQTIGAMKNAQRMIASPLIKQVVKTKGGIKALWDKVATEEAFNVLEDVKRQISENAGERAPALIKMLDELRRESILDLSWIAELRDISEGQDTGTGQKILDASRIMSHLTEVNNRIMTAIAAYDLAVTTQTHEEAIEYAKDVTQSTHFDYSSGAKPLMFRPDGPLGAAAPLVFQFMQWPQHMYAMMISNMVKVFKTQGVERTEAARILGGLLGTHMLAGGIIGMSLQPIKWAFGLAMMALGSEDEPYTFTSAMSGETFDRYVQEGIANVAGAGAAELLSRGVPAAVLGTDLSDRMALGTLYFLDLRTETAESTLGSVAMSFGGPWLTIGQNGFRSAHDIYNGDIVRGIERSAPKMVRDFLKTYRYASEGLVNNAGDTVINGDGVPPVELFLQGMGFSSATVSNFYNRQSAIKDTERFGAERRTSLVNQFVRATTPEDRNKVLQDVTDFNRAFPAAAITRSTLVRAAQGKVERENNYSRYGANLRGKAQSYADEGWYYQ